MIGSTLLAAAALSARAESTATDVTPRSFSVVWASPAAIGQAAVRVYDDASGTTDLTDGLMTEVVSADHPPAHEIGLAKVRISGLAAGQCVHYRTETNGSALDPAAPPYPQICTANAVRRRDPGGMPLANDLIRQPLFAPDDTTPGTGSLALLSVPGAGAHPISAFFDPGFASGNAVFNLNNLFAESDGESFQVADGTAVEIVELRGLRCPGLADHARTRVRRVPPHEELAAIGTLTTSVESLVPCNAADLDCDDAIEAEDADPILGTLGAAPPECRWNPDHDLATDGPSAGRIDVLDLQTLLNQVP